MYFTMHSHLPKDLLRLLLVCSAPKTVYASARVDKNMSTVVTEPRFLGGMRKYLRTMQSFWSEIYADHFDLLCLPNGKADGREEVWHGNNLTELDYWHDGVPHGIHETWYYTGGPFERGYHINGKRHGPDEAWHTNGQLAGLIEFDHDKIIKAQYWDENGLLWHSN